jgi:hypothetical protein
MDLQHILNTPPRRLPSEIPETPSLITSTSRASIQSWGSQNGDRPGSSLYATQDSLSLNNSFDSVTTLVTNTPPSYQETTRDKRIQI